MDFLHAIDDAVGEMAKKVDAFSSSETRRATIQRLHARLVELQGNRSEVEKSFHLLQLTVRHTALISHRLMCAVRHTRCHLEQRESLGAVRRWADACKTTMAAERQQQLRATMQADHDEMVASYKAEIDQIRATMQADHDEAAARYEAEIGQLAARCKELENLEVLMRQYGLDTAS